MTSEELERLVVERNRTRTEYPRDRCVHQLFEERAAEVPNAIAITQGTTSITYGELNGQANQLAHRLRGLGVGSGDLVGVCLDRSIGMVTAFLAVLKASGAYVPLDPDYPRQRMSPIVGGLTRGIVITSSKYEGRLPPGSCALYLEREAEEIGQQPRENLPNYALAEGVALVIYTSGSLGAPKGVCCSHRGVVRVGINTNYVDLKSDDTVVHASSPVFDATTFEVFAALLNGARILIVEKETLLANDEFAELLRREKATVLFMTTALFNLKAHEAPRTFESLRILMFGGETADPSSVRRILALGPPQRLLHMYGPTENTVFSTFYDVREVAEGATSIPLGGNISNSTSYILDRDLQPVPAGVKGEIYVSGDGVALGYLNQPDLSLSAFLPNPFEPGKTLYKTGDLGKFLADGSIEFLGREDLQAKVRGFRVELGEVEAALASHPSVRAGAVVVREGVRGREKRLVAYVLPVRGAEAKVREIRSYMREQLPEYMIPSSFVILDSLPLTSSGKIDRRLLPEPPDEEPGMELAGADEGDVEARLASLWSQVLGVAHVGRDDNFFEIGGYSLMAVRLFSEIEREFGIKLPIASIFRAPTVAKLAEEIRRGRPEGSVSLVPMRASGTRPPLFLIHAQDGEVYNYGQLAEALGDDQPVYGIRAVGLHDDTPLPVTVEDMAKDYIEDMRRVQPHGSYYIAGFCSGAIIAFEMAQQLLGAGEEVGLLGVMDSEAPGPSRWKSHRWARTMLLRETLFYGSDLLRYARKKSSQESLEMLPRLALLGKLWMAFFRIIPTTTVLLPGEARQLPKSWRRVIINQTRMMIQYRPQKYEGVMTVFKRKLLPLLNNPDPADGWRRYAGGGIVVIPMMGRTHFNMLKPPGVLTTAERLRERIDWYERRRAVSI